MKPVLKNLMPKHSESVEKSTKSKKLWIFSTWDFLFLKLKYSYFAFAKKTSLQKKRGFQL